MEGDGQIGGGGGELEGAASPDVPSQDASRDLVAVGDGQHVAVADVQSEEMETKEPESGGPGARHQFRTREDDSESSRVDRQACGR